MKITAVSFATPTAFNCGAASALPYHLAKYRNSDIELEIYSFDINRIKQETVDASAKELNARITVVPLPAWYRMLFKLHLLFIRAFLRYPIGAYIRLPKSFVCKIMDSQPDAIWIYGEELSFIANQFAGTKCVVTTPDCEAMYYYRELCHRGNVTNKISLLKYTLMYLKYTRMAEQFPTENVKYHLVGIQDCTFLKNINPKVDATFINHPHYDYSDKKIIGFSEKKIRLLVTGRYDLYMKDKCDELFTQMAQKSDDLSKHYQITFLGKDWECWSERLSDAGYVVNVIRFAPDYAEELIKHDILLSPIGVGTGTKGKVLDALANGLLVIGTERALENIQIENHKSCVQYDTPEEAIEILRNVIANRELYEDIAGTGCRAVLEHHNREKISSTFFNLFKD